MKQTLKTLTLTAALSLAASLASAATAFTDPVGALSFTIRGNSDNYISVPFAKAADFQGTLSGTPTGSGNSRTLDITGTPGFTVNAFQNLWYVKFSSGPASGRYYTVTSNTATALTIDTNGDSTVGTSVAGNSFKLIKYWTLGEIFPSGQTAVTPSADSFESAPASSVLVPFYAGSGVDLPAGSIYFPALDHSGNGYGWADTSDPFTPADNVALPPDGFIIIRRSVAGNTTFVSSGSVSFDDTVFGAFASNTQNEDNYVGLARPKDVELSSLFSGSGFNPSADSFSTDGDILLFYSNEAFFVGLDRPASAIFIKDVNGDWYDTSDPFTTQNTTLIPAGSGLVIRKAIVGVSGTQFVTNTKNY